MLRVLTLLAFGVMAHGASLCPAIAGDLPSFCHCYDKPDGLLAVCSINLFGANLNATLDIEPCGNPAHLSMNVSGLGINYEIVDVSVGQDLQVPIPGLNIDIPDVGEAGVVADIKLSGNAANLEAAIGIDACGSVLGFKVCGSKLTSDLPIWILDGTFHFLDCVSPAPSVRLFPRNWDPVKHARNATQ